jgi:hypothetical protein
MLIQHRHFRALSFTFEDLNPPFFGCQDIRINLTPMGTPKVDYVTKAVTLDGRSCFFIRT